jgi:hypothetical protein
VIEQPLPLDRVTLILAREEAEERLLPLGDVLADGEDDPDADDADEGEPGQALQAVEAV